MTADQATRESYMNESAELEALRDALAYINQVWDDRAIVRMPERQLIPLRKATRILKDAIRKAEEGNSA